jgi:hypothetical protein
MMKRLAVAVVPMGALLGGIVALAAAPGNATSTQGSTQGQTQVNTPT